MQMHRSCAAVLDRAGERSTGPAPRACALPRLSLQQLHLVTVLRAAHATGDALLFFNLDAAGRPDPHSMHAGCPVLAGVKWTATKWIHAAPFRPEWLSSPKPLAEAQRPEECADTNAHCQGWARTGAAYRPLVLYSHWHGFPGHAWERHDWNAGRGNGSVRFAQHRSQPQATAMAKPPVWCGGTSSRVT